jgi:cytochrome c-type biogenesis protein CcmH/NrfF
VAKLPAPAVSTASSIVLLVAMGLLSAAPLAAQVHIEDPNAAITPSRNELEEQLRHEIGCICGTCAHEPLSKCTCGTAQKMRADLREHVEQGQNREEIIASLIDLYGGQHFLMAPIDSGFNRLAWLLPYAAAGTGIVLIGFVATRWSRRRDSEGEAPAPVDPDLEERLDDELRNLD